MVKKIKCPLKPFIYKYYNRTKNGSPRRIFRQLITMLELIWGEGYMTPGGSDNVEKMFNGIENSRKNVSLILVVV